MYIIQRYVSVMFAAIFMESYMNTNNIHIIAQNV